MTGKRQWKRIPGSLVIASAFVLAGAVGTASTATAQDFPDLQTPNSALVLSAQGSFYVGGSLMDEPNCPGVQADTSCPIMADQMYVRYMVPQAKKGKNNMPVVMISGAGLTGKLFETTPDGRMGWDEYFVRNGHASYVVDAPWRGRSGFNYTRFQKGNPPNMITISTPSPERAWVSFRIGPEFDVPFDDTQFPTEAINELAKQGYPFFFLGSPFGGITSVSQLVTSLEGAIVFGHSFTGSWPVQAARLLQQQNNENPVKATVNIDGCPGAGAPLDTEEGNAELQTLVNIPMLGVVGDHDEDRGGSNHEACTAFIERFAALGGFAEVIYPPDLGINGNTHLMMIDKNNTQIADLILEWIDENVDK
jgi:hypothetical protein